MGWSEWLLIWTCVALEGCIAWLLLRWRAWRCFPVYSIYIVFILFRACLLVASLSHPPTYFWVYWITAPVEILLTILAELESFWRVFRSFRLLRWFWLVLPAAVIATLAYSAWRGYRFPPVEASPAGAAIIHAAVTSHYVILSISILFFLLAALFHIPWRIHEHRFILGFGVASLAVAFGGSVRAVFGPRLAFVSQQAQPIGYLIALLIWLSAVIHPLPKEGVVLEPPVEILGSLKFQLRNLRSFVRKGAR